MRLVMTRAGQPQIALGPGWSEPEQEQSWAVGKESWLYLEAPRAQRPCRLALRLWPHLRRPSLPHQRLLVEANRRLVAEAVVTGRRTVFGLIPPECLANRDMLGLRLIHPDCARPCDFPDSGNEDQRCLAIAYEFVEVAELAEDEAQLTAAIEAGLGALQTVPAPPGHPAASMPAAELLAHFESAGDDCEFGFVQRFYGIEALGLLRFAGLALENLVPALNARFAGIASGDTLRMVGQVDRPEEDIMGHEQRYGLTYHTYRFARDTDIGELHRTEMRRLPRLAEKFMEDAESGEKIFIVKSKNEPHPAQIGCILAAFRRTGRATLLWIREAPKSVMPGTAGWLMPGLMVGFVDRLEAPPMKQISPDSWLAACRAAYAIWKG